MCVGRSSKYSRDGDSLHLPQVILLEQFAALEAFPNLGESCILHILTDSAGEALSKVYPERTASRLYCNWKLLLIPGQKQLR